MYFLILACDRPGMLDQRLARRQEHIDYWNGLGGKVKVAGAMLAGDAADAAAKGSALLIEADSLDSARAALNGDPFMVYGIFGDDVRIETFRPGIGSWLRT